MTITESQAQIIMSLLCYSDSESCLGVNQAQLGLELIEAFPETEFEYTRKQLEVKLEHAQKQVAANLAHMAMIQEGVDRRKHA